MKGRHLRLAKKEVNVSYPLYCKIFKLEIDYISRIWASLARFLKLKNWHLDFIYKAGTLFHLPQAFSSKIGNCKAKDEPKLIALALKHRNGIGTIRTRGGRSSGAAFFLRHHLSIFNQERCKRDSQKPCNSLRNSPRAPLIIRRENRIS